MRLFPPETLSEHLCEGRSMTKDEFLEAARTRNIDPRSFGLDHRRDECHVLETRDTKWTVFYSERGLESGIRHFPTESDALEYLLSVLRPDF
ncbi:hypothetical protein CIW50_12435 [Tardiphaga sp. P9-11]|jgi:hypothetical protein|nr:hypothetical protein CIW50_12435 [Tardiphaga sp. P9-11]